MRFARALVILVGLAACLSGCGQKGPLIQPDAQRPHKKVGLGRPPAAPAPAPQGPAGAPPGAGTPSTTADPSPSTPQPH